jgi:hypothetical protein
MHTLPTTQYTGLCLIQDKPSRFDTDNNRLCAGPAGIWLENEVFHFPLSGVDIRDLSEKAPLLTGTKKIALLGRDAADYYGNGLGQHGYSLIVKGCQAVAAFAPQDCCDHRNVEGQWTDNDDDKHESERDTKDTAATQRRNYRFWTHWHLQKLLTTTPRAEPKPQIITFPLLSVLNKLLNNLHNEEIYLDIETSRVHRAITCIGFSWRSIWPTVYVVPVYRTNGMLAYPNFHLFHRALSLAFTRNTVVAHNACFDLFILRAFYKFFFPRSVYDTMLANHRMFPEAEKSLGHLIGQWTWQPYHKDQNTEAYNRVQEEQLWRYNALDVYNLKLIKDAQTNYAASRLGLPESIAQANDSVIPYLSNSLVGLRLNQVKLIVTSQSLKLAATQYARIASILVGAPFNPGSPQQCKAYFYDKLKYQATSRTPEGAPKLGRKQFYQFLLKTNNPLINVCLRYRKAAKDASMLESELFTEP